MNLFGFLSAFFALEALGFRTSFAAALAALDEPLLPARVISDFGSRYEVSDGVRGLLAQPSGRLRRLRPTVGDWVAISRAGVIHHVLPRATELVRRAAGKRGEPQVIAANVDCFFVVTSANRDANARRLERYLAIVWDSGATPVVVINKAELVSAAELAVRHRELAQVAPGVAVLAVSAHTGEGVAALRSYVPRGATVGLIGSSGVGKSSLVNRLLGEARQDVRAIDDNDRGRHATTRRALFALPGGGQVIDTPGMRELGLVDAGGLDDVFADVAELAAACRFRDCRHRGEPGCAVAAAVDDGALAAGRRDGLHKLERELARDPHEDKARWKAIHKSQRARTKVDPKLAR